MFYKNPKFDQLMLAGQTTVNLQPRTAIYREAQAVVWQDASWIFLSSQNFLRCNKQSPRRLEHRAHGEMGRAICYMEIARAVPVQRAAS